MSRYECWIASHLNGRGRLDRLGWQLGSISAGEGLDRIRVEASLGDGLHRHDVSEVVLAGGGVVEFSRERRSQFEHISDLQKRIGSPDMYVMAADDDDLCHRDRASIQRRFMHDHPELVAGICRGARFQHWGCDNESNSWESAMARGNFLQMTSEGYSWWDYGGMIYRTSYLQRVLDSCEDHNMLLSNPIFDLYFRVRANSENKQMGVCDEMKDEPLLALYRVWSKLDHTPTTL